MAEPLTPELEAARSSLVEQIADFAKSRTPAELDALRSAVGALLTNAGAEGISRLMNRIVTTGAEWTYHPPEPLARTVQHALADVVLGPDSTLVGGEHLDAAKGRPLLLLCNHLSYADANLLEILMRRAGYGDFSDRLTVVVGPKVYSDVVRRFSSLCFGTVKTPQSSALSSEEAVMGPRAVAKLALDTIAVAGDRLLAGDALLIFVEGTRSRTGAMQRALPAVMRYFESPGTLLLPVGITGSEKLVPVGDEHLHTAQVTITIGKGGGAQDLVDRGEGNRRLVMDAVGIAVARLLPEHYRGEYGDHGAEVEGLDEARALSDAVFGGER